MHCCQLFAKQYKSRTVFFEKQLGNQSSHCEKNLISFIKERKPSHATAGLTPFAVRRDKS